MIIDGQSELYYWENNSFSLSDQIKLEKCNYAEKILDSNWRSEFIETPFLDLLDVQKVAFDIPLQELNKILKTDSFTLEEKNYIKRLRHQGRNNKAAQRLRSKNRQQNEGMKKIIYDLEVEKNLLIQERENLIQQLISFERYFSNSEDKVE